ncbi:hypothetical protein JCM9533A_33520 [Catenuloplanes niger JCM 9533]
MARGVVPAKAAASPILTWRGGMTAENMTAGTSFVLGSLNETTCRYGRCQLASAGL